MPPRERCLDASRTIVTQARTEMEQPTAADDAPRESACTTHPIRLASCSWSDVMLSNSKVSCDVRNAAVRGIVGFLAGFFVAGTALGLLEAFAPPDNPIRLKLDQPIWFVATTLLAGAIVAVVSVIVGRTRISTFWAWFCVFFGLLCLVPWWRGIAGGLLPLGTAYVNRGFPSVGKLLAGHIVVSLVLALLLPRLWSRLTHRESKNRVG